MSQYPSASKAATVTNIRRAAAGSCGQVENAEVLKRKCGNGSTETEVRKRKYGNGSTETASSSDEPFVEDTAFKQITEIQILSTYLGSRGVFAQSILHNRFA